MKIKQLIEKLQKMPPEAVAVFPNMEINETLEINSVTKQKSYGQEIVVLGM